MLRASGRTAPPVLFIGLNYAPEPIGIGPYSAGLCGALAEAGHPVTAIVGKPYYPRWEIDPGFAAHGWLHAREAGVSIVRCPHYVPRHPSGLRRIAHLLSFALAAFPAALAAAWRQRPEVVFCVAPALLSVVTAWAVARLYGARLWIHVQDFEVEAAFATDLLPARGILARLAVSMEGWLLRRGDRVTAISPQMVQRLMAKGVPPPACAELRNWADPGFAPDPAGAEQLRSEWAIGDRIVALYSGNLARKQGSGVLAEAARQLTGRPDIVFVICGEGSDRAELAAAVASLPNVMLQPLQPATRMGALLAMADLHLLPQIAEAADLVLPSKLTNMLASGRPIVATAAVGSGLFAEVDGCGLCVPPGDAARLAAAITDLADQPARRRKMGAAASERARARWHRDTILTEVSWAVIGLTRPGQPDPNRRSPRGSD